MPQVLLKEIPIIIGFAVQILKVLTADSSAVFVSENDLDVSTGTLVFNTDGPTFLEIKFALEEMGS